MINKGKINLIEKIIPLLLISLVAGIFFSCSKDVSKNSSASEKPIILNIEPVYVFPDTAYAAKDSMISVLEAKQLDKINSGQIEIERPDYFSSEYLKKKDKKNPLDHYSRQIKFNGATLEEIGDIYISVLDFAGSESDTIFTPTSFGEFTIKLPFMIHDFKPSEINHYNIIIRKEGIVVIWK